MKANDFGTTILVDQTPEQVFDAIINTRSWWSGDITGGTKKLNDEFVYSYKEFHTTKQRIVELVPGKKIVWLVTESSINYAADKNEWKGTKIIFDIEKQGDKTQLRFTHQGLVPEIECFGSCSGAWTQLVQQGLVGLITTGKNSQVVL